MNEDFGVVKARVRRLDALLTSTGARTSDHMAFAQAVSVAHRLVRDGDRSRAPTPALRAAVDKAEQLGRALEGR